MIRVGKLIKDGKLYELMAILELLRNHRLKERLLTSDMSLANASGLHEI